MASLPTSDSKPSGTKQPVQALIQKFSTPGVQSAFDTASNSSPRTGGAARGGQAAGNPKAVPDSPTVARNKHETVAQATTVTGAGASEAQAAPKDQASAAASSNGDPKSTDGATIHTSGKPDADAADRDVRALQDKCSQLDARLSKQNAAVLEFETELQIYEAGVHEALLKLGIEEGSLVPKMCYLSSVPPPSPAAAAHGSVLTNNLSLQGCEAWTAEQQSSTCGNVYRRSSIPKATCSADLRR